MSKFQGFEENTRQYLGTLKTASEDASLTAKQRALAAGILANVEQQIEIERVRVLTPDDYPAEFEIRAVVRAFSAHCTWERVLRETSGTLYAWERPSKQLTPEEA